VLDAAAVPADLPAVTQRRLPVVNLHNARQVEGDGTGTATIALPYTVTGDSSSPGRIVVLAQDFSTGNQLPRQVITIAPHSTGGTIDIPYRPNRRDDLNRRLIAAAAFATRGVATGSYFGTATILDDDPAPHFTVAPVKRTVHEGSRAHWAVTLSKPTGYFLEMSARPVRGDTAGARLTVGDLPRHFRRTHLSPVPPLDTPLWKTKLRLFASVEPGETTARTWLPIEADDSNEPPRSVSMRFRSLGHGVDSRNPVATVRVRD
jgi:hypothetical protein